MRHWPYSPAARFSLRRPGESEEAGMLLGNVLRLRPFVESVPYDGLVRIDDAGPWVQMARSSQTYGGRIEGLEWHRPDGEIWHMHALAPNSHHPSMRPRIEDPFAYAAAVDLLDYWAEVQPGGAIACELSLLVDLAAFYRCPACCAAPSAREACVLCLGEGFVWEGVSAPRHPASSV